MSAHPMRLFSRNLVGKGTSSPIATGREPGSAEAEWSAELIERSGERRVGHRDGGHATGARLGGLLAGDLELRVAVQRFGDRLTAGEMKQSRSLAGGSWSAVALDAERPTPARTPRCRKRRARTTLKLGAFCP